MKNSSGGLWRVHQNLEISTPAMPKFCEMHNNVMDECVRM